MTKDRATWKVRTGQNELFSIFQPLSKTRAGKEHVKSTYGENALFCIIFSPGPRPGHLNKRYRANLTHEARWGAHWWFFCYFHIVKSCYSSKWQCSSIQDKESNCLLGPPENAWIAWSHDNVKIVSRGLGCRIKLLQLLAGYSFAE